MQGAKDVDEGGWASRSIGRKQRPGGWAENALGVKSSEVTVEVTTKEGWGSQGKEVEEGWFENVPLTGIGIS